MRRDEMFITCSEKVKEKLLDMFDECCPFDYQVRFCDGLMCDDCITHVNIHWETDNEYED